MKFGKLFTGWGGGVAAGLAVVAAGVLGWWLIGPGPKDEAAPPAQVATLPGAQVANEAPAGQAQDGADTPSVAAPAEEPPAAEAPALDQPPSAEDSAAPDDGAEAAPAPLAPVFDVVRIRPDGDALVAGSAEPGARVNVLVDGEMVAEALADAGAGFVAMFDLPPLEADRVMTLEARLADGTRLISDTSVIVQGVDLPDVVASAGIAAEPAPAPAPEGPSTPEPEVTTAPEQEAATAADATLQTAETVAAPEPETPRPAAPLVAEAEVAQPEAPRILLAGPEGVRVLQEPGPNPQLSIDAIAYDAAGEVALSGRGREAQTLRIYLDNAPVGVVEVGPEGQWRAPLPDIAAGLYTLRVDGLSPEGTVTSRVETPFQRTAPEVLAAAGAQAAPGQAVSAITVQPGHTLWAIAEGRYGEGIAYWTIFDANRDQIRDPDWIYPGQVFALPDAD